MDGLTVVPGEPKHLKAVVAIARMDVDLLGWAPKVVFAEAIDHGHLLVAVADDRVYGFVEYGGTTKDKWTIYKIATVQQARGKGVGSALVEVLAERAAVAGCGVRLKVTEDNHRAILFYQQHQFHMVSMERSKKRNVWLMEREK